MASGAAPDTITDRHRLLATYVALGYSNEDAGRECGLSENRVSTIRQSPLFVHEVEQERRRIRERITSDALGLLHAEAITSVQRLAQLRDQSDNLNVALGASNSIVDRVVPKTLRHEEERTFRIVFDAEIMAEMRDALVEDGVVIEATDTDVVLGVRAVPRALSAVLSLDDVIAEARAAELAEVEPA